MILHMVDNVILGVIGLSALTGLYRGFSKELISLGVWGLAIWLGLSYSDLLSPWLKPYIDDHSVQTVVGFVIILFATLLAGGLVNVCLSLIMQRSGLSGTDRLLGMIFGVVRGIFIVALVIVVMNMTSVNQKEYVRKSVLYGEFTPLVRWLTALMPDFIHQAKLHDPDIQSI